MAFFLGWGHTLTVDFGPTWLLELEFILRNLFWSYHEEAKRKLVECDLMSYFNVLECSVTFFSNPVNCSNVLHFLHYFFFTARFTLLGTFSLFPHSKCTNRMHGVKIDIEAIIMQTYTYNCSTNWCCVKMCNVKTAILFLYIVSVGITCEYKAQASKLQVNCGLLEDVAFWLWAAVRPLQLMRHLDTMSHFRYMRGPAPAKQVSDAVLRARCSRWQGQDSICHHYRPIKKFHRVQLPSFMKRLSAMRACSGVAITLITTAVVFSEVKKRAWGILFCLWGNICKGRDILLRKKA